MSSEPVPVGTPRPPRSLRFAAAAALLGVVAAVSASAQSSAPAAAGAARAPAVEENTGPNTVITRRASGTYRYETIASGRHRGTERFELMAHPDGSRTLLMWHDLAARNAQFTVVLRNDAQLRPLEAFVSYWNGGRFKGSAHFLVEGTRLTAQASGPAGVIPQATVVPPWFSIGTHPVAGDGWHTAGYDAARGGEQVSTLYSLEAGTDPMKPVLGTLLPLKLERLGDETVEVPAGRFAATHWRVAGVNDLWVVGPDRLVVKSVIPARDLQYLLVEADGALREAALPTAAVSPSASGRSAPPSSTRH